MGRFRRCRSRSCRRGSTGPGGPSRRREAGERGGQLGRRGEDARGEAEAVDGRIGHAARAAHGGEVVAGYIADGTARLSPGSIDFYRKGLAALPETFFAIAQSPPSRRSCWTACTPSCATRVQGSTRRRRSTGCSIGLARDWAADFDSADVVAGTVEVRVVASPVRPGDGRFHAVPEKGSARGQGPVERFLLFLLACRVRACEGSS